MLIRITGRPPDGNSGRLRAECLNTHWFADLKEARQLIEAGRREYDDIGVLPGVRGSGCSSKRMSEPTRMTSASFSFEEDTSHLHT